MKIEIVYHEGMWLVLDGSGKVIGEAYREGWERGFPVSIESRILAHFGLQEEDE